MRSRQTTTRSTSSSSSSSEARSGHDSDASFVPPSGADSNPLPRPTARRPRKRRRAAPSSPSSPSTAVPAAPPLPAPPSPPPPPPAQPSGLPDACAGYHIVWVGGELVLRPLSPPGAHRPFRGRAPGAPGGAVDYVLDGGGGEGDAEERALRAFAGSERYTAYLRARRSGVRALDVEFDQSLEGFVRDAFRGCGEGREAGGRALARCERLVAGVNRLNPGLRLAFADAALRGWRRVLGLPVDGDGGGAGSA